MKQMIQLLALLNVCALYGSADNHEFVKPKSYTMEELGIRNALLNTGMQQEEVDSLIQANKQQTTIPNAPPECYASSTIKSRPSTPDPTDLPSPKKNKDAFRKKMVELAKQNTFSNLGK